VQKTQLDKSNEGAREPSEVISRYLEAIYYMWSEGEPTRSARLADWLGVSRPTVTVALRRMARDGMVRMNGRKEIELTKAGKRAAESIVRRHRIMERWLTDVLGGWALGSLWFLLVLAASQAVAGRRAARDPERDSV